LSRLSEINARAVGIRQIKYTFVHQSQINDYAIEYIEIAVDDYMAIHHIFEILFHAFIPDDFYDENIIDYSNEREYRLKYDDEN
jgi:hypothetical protein